MSGITTRCIQEIRNQVLETIERSCLEKNIINDLNKKVHLIIETNLLFSSLTSNEYKTLELSARGKKSNEISVLLYKSTRCINLYKVKIQEKLLVESYEQALVKFTEYKQHLKNSQNTEIN